MVPRPRATFRGRSDGIVEPKELFAIRVEDAAKSLSVRRRAKRLCGEKQRAASPLQEQLPGAAFDEAALRESVEDAHEGGRTDLKQIAEISLLDTLILSEISDRLRLRAGYATISRALSESLVCASDTYRVDVDSYVIADGHSAEGHWQETTRQVQGNLTGQIVDGDLEGGVVGPGFTAEISLRATGRRQIMSIKPQGGDVNHVTVVLSPEN